MKLPDEILERLKKTECPFTWEFDAINEAIKEHRDSREHDEENFVPLLKWIRCLMHVYENVQTKDLKEAENSLKSAEDIWDSLKTKHEKDVSLKVLENIFKGTKCFLLSEEDRCDEIKEILETLNEDIDCDNDPKDKSTLNGCKSLAWSTHKSDGVMAIKKAIELAKLAIQNNQNCDMWQFVLGKNLRRQRRLENFLSSPSRQEEIAFQKAYELSEEPTFGIYFAQLHKEKRNIKQALSIYQKIYDSKPESASVHLRLALGFIRLNDLPLAKNCLDYAEKVLPEDSMFLHYKGIYLESKHNYKEAAEYFKKASNGNNFGAENSFLKCKAKSKEKYDFVKHLEEMLITYGKYDGRVLDITLQLAACYYMCNHDLPNAAKCYLQALEKFPNNKIFEKHQCILGGSTCIYTFLLTDFLPNAFDTSDLNSETKEICEKLRKICIQQERSQPRNQRKLENSFRGMKLS